MSIEEEIKLIHQRTKALNDKHNVKTGDPVTKAKEEINLSGFCKHSPSIKGPEVEYLSESQFSDGWHAARLVYPLSDGSYVELEVAW